MRIRDLSRGSRHCMLQFIVLNLQRVPEGGFASLRQNGQNYVARGFVRYDLQCMLFIRLVKFKKNKQAGHVARTGQKRIITKFYRSKT